MRSCGRRHRRWHRSSRRLLSCFDCILARAPWLRRPCDVRVAFQVAGVPQRTPCNAFGVGALDSHNRPMIELTVNGKQVQIDAPEEMPLLWALRDVLGLTGTKFGCGMAQCGACTVHVDDQPVRSCVRPVGTLAGKRITTIEGLAGAEDHPVQVAWARLNV